MKAKSPVLQVLFEPWPAEANADREGYEVFAGQYLLDAIEPDGSLRDRGFRAVVAGCTTCRRSDTDEHAHWMQANDLKPEGPKRRCPQWKKVEAIVKEFGGWAQVHYVELAANEGLGYQAIPQRRREIMKCPACDGSGYAGWDATVADFVKCDAGCGSYTHKGRGEVQIAYEGPVRPDRFAMSEAQRRMR